MYFYDDFQVLEFKYRRVLIHIDKIYDFML